MTVELNTKPWCNCILRGVWHPKDGWSLDRPSGLWVHPRCRKPSQMNYRRAVLGLPMLPQKSHIIHDIYDHEKRLDDMQWGRSIIDDELNWDSDDLD